MMKTLPELNPKVGDRVKVVANTSCRLVHNGSEWIINRIETHREKGIYFFGVKEYWADKHTGTLLSNDSYFAFVDKKPELEDLSIPALLKADEAHIEALYMQLLYCFEWAKANTGFPQFKRDDIQALIAEHVKLKG